MREEIIYLFVTGISTVHQLQIKLLFLQEKLDKLDEAKIVEFAGIINIDKCISNMAMHCVLPNVFYK